ncbi:MAG: hypothetical protein KDE58_37005 [Caldilineaceae bacterium]|nr:hypothetical protein [Caldilineaceae bacterium]
MVESLLLIKGPAVDAEVLRALSFGNAKQVVVGPVPGGSVVLYIAAESAADLGRAQLDLAQVAGVTAVVTLALHLLS